ncbi:pyruvate carboxylase [Streptococcaceae bacterium ESL0687]|nr:pyruvate carboxylase [Streptococcaceae bacterium ESL0687]
MQKVLVANRGEIATRVFRACTELNISTVAIYAAEDEYSVHRFKADEAYLVGAGKKPIEAYLDIEDIIRIAKDTNASAIHPGYGFLSENIDLAKRCEEEGIIFIGPSIHHLDIFGDKIKAKQAALDAGISPIPGTKGSVAGVEDILEFADKYGYPIMIKAALGGGGRGMRIARNEKEAREGYERARSEAKSAFGSDEVYAERYIGQPKHIEVQILGDEHGNVVHLFERDCSVQRRHQKVVEVAPCISLTDEMRDKICQAAVQIMKHVGYVNAGTVEFLVEDDDFYFIEVNPRVQVEHTITEMITDIDIVQSQILIAQGLTLEECGIPKQEEITHKGVAIQCRITTEDPLNDFMPDTGKIDTYRSPGGFGVRLDVGNAYAGAVVTPYFDSLLVKVCTHASSLEQAIQKMERCLREFRIRGVKTNIPFMQNVINHEAFRSGTALTTFIDNEPDLFKFSATRDRGNKTLKYISQITVNGFPGVEKSKKFISDRYLPKDLNLPDKKIITAKNVLDLEGADAVSNWVKEEKKILLTDTTFRDAHQSLLATRLRTKDLLEVASLTEKAFPNLFSAEMWGGATFDVSYRFLTEDPWERLRKFRAAMPNTLMQMLFRGSNAVGYSNYPDNVLVEFIKEAASQGIDVFRIFDSLNWVEQMDKSIQAVRDAGKIAEATICYTGDINNPNRQKYSLKYYKELARELEALGAHIIAIKDMAGLLKPQAAYELISELKDVTSLPIHLHTHDTSGNGIFTYAEAVRAGVDIVDLAIPAMSSATSQPSMTSLYYALEGSDRKPDFDVENADKINQYWQGVRADYKAFENGMTGPNPSVYMHEMPGGQYSNLQQQAKGVGLGDRWDEVTKMYQTVNMLFGDIVKVTPSSKVVGDMALFMVENGLNEENIYEKGRDLSFPDSVISFFRGDLGQPAFGFPKELQKLVLKDQEAYTVRPGSLAKEVDFEALSQELEGLIGYKPKQEELLSYIMYPKVFLDYRKNYDQYADINLLDTPTFFQGMEVGEAITFELEKGKSLLIRLDQVGDVDDRGDRTLYFNLNGQRREIVVNDASAKTSTIKNPKADSSNDQEIGATMTGSVLKVLVKAGDKVQKGDGLFITEAMKMETSIQAPFAGTVKRVLVQDGDRIETGDLLVELEKN